MNLENVVIAVEQEQKIKDNAPDKIPLNPTAQGWTGAEVRRRIAQSIVGTDGSILEELKTKLTIIKGLFESIFGDGQGNIQEQIDLLMDQLVNGILFFNSMEEANSAVVPEGAFAFIVTKVE